MGHRRAGHGRAAAAVRRRGARNLGRHGRQLDFRETWRFDDGRSDTLAWKIRHVGNARYTGTEQRLSGEAEGEQQGCAFHWQYSRDTPLGDDKSMLLDYNDWFYRIDERVVTVRGSAGRAGLPFVILHATYRRIS